MATQEPKRGSLQEEIDFQVSEAGGKCFSFIVRNKEGNAVVPANVHIRFYNCKFDSLIAGNGNNNFYFSSCQFNKKTSNFLFKGVAAILQNCTFNDTFIIESSKLELLGCTITQLLMLNKNTYVRSIRNNWKGTKQGNTDPDTAVLCDGSSLMEVILDSFSGWQSEVFSLKNNSVIKCKNCSLDNIKKSLVRCASKSVFAWSGTSKIETTSSEDDAIIFDLDDSVLTADSSTDISAKTISKLRNGARLRFRSIDNLEAREGFVFDIDNGYVETVDVPNMSSSSGKAILVKNGTVDLRGIVSISAVSDDTINVTHSSINIYSTDSAAKISSSAGYAIFVNDNDTSVINLNGIAGGLSSQLGAAAFFQKSTILLKDVGKIEGSTGITVIDSSLRAIGTTDILGRTGVGVTGRNSKLFLDIATVKSNSSNNAAIQVSGSKLIAKNLTTISGGSGIQLSNSTALFSDILNVTGTQQDGIQVSDGSYLLTDGVKNINGNVYGINASNAGGGKIDLRDFENINGNTYGIFGSSVDVELNAEHSLAALVKGNIGIYLTSSVEGAFNLNMVGKLRINGSSQAMFTNGIYVTERGVTYDGDVVSSRSLIESDYSHALKNIQASQSLVYQRRGAIDGSMTALSASHVESTGSSWNKDAVNKNSIILQRLSLLAQGYSVLQNAAHIGILSTTKDAQAVDSILVSFGGKLGNVSPTGRSTVLAGALGSGTITPALDSPQSPVAALTASGGSLLLQADDEIDIESSTLNMATRDHIIFDSVGTTVAITAENDLTITSNTGKVTITASTELTASVGDSMLDLVPDTATLSATTVNI